MEETPANQASSEIESTPPLVLPTWAQSLLEVLHVMVLGAGWLCAIVGCVALMHGYSVSLEVLGWMLVPVVWIVSVCIHEYGHVLGARAAGMTPYLMHIGPLQMWALNRGWRVRLRRTRRGYSGLVMAHMNPYAGLRRQELTMTAAGPGANLIAAVIAALSALLVEQPEVNAFLLGVAGFNLAIAIANLLPRRGTFASDGMRILEWWKGINEDAPQFLIPRLDGYSVKGVTADNLPADLLTRLRSQPSPFLLCHSWYFLKGLQNRHEWAQVLEHEALLEERIAGLPTELKASFGDLVGMMRCEIAFSKVMAGQSLDHAIDHELGSELDWTNPSLRPRCRALMAVRQGDDELARSLLRTSERYVSRSIDRALHLSEARIREAIVREMRR
jgi:Zn-dependent protease